MAPLETQEQLQLAGDTITQVAKIIQERSLLTLKEIDSMMHDEGPVVPADFFNKFVRQSMHVDFAQFVEPPPSLPRSSPQHRKQRFSNDGCSVVVVIDKAALLEVLEPELDDKTAKAEALAVAHAEDISAWVETISLHFDSMQAKSLSLIEIVKKVKYPVVKGEKKATLVKTWLALLIGGFTLEQQCDFYDSKVIWSSSLR